MMTVEYVNSVLAEIGDLPSPTPLLIQQVEEIYKYLFGRPIGRHDCKNRISDSVIEIKIKLKRTGVEKQRYILKRGVVLQFHETGEFYNRDSMTDEVAKRWLRKTMNPSKFESIPDNWEEEIRTTTSNVVKKTTKKKATIRKPKQEE